MFGIVIIDPKGMFLPSCKPHTGNYWSVGGDHVRNHHGMRISTLLPAIRHQSQGPSGSILCLLVNDEVKVQRYNGIRIPMDTDRSFFANFSIRPCFMSPLRIRPLSS